MFCQTGAIDPSPVILAQTQRKPSVRWDRKQEVRTMQQPTEKRTITNGSHFHTESDQAAVNVYTSHSFNTTKLEYHTGNRTDLGPNADP